MPFLDIFGQYLFVVLRSVISSLVDKEEQGKLILYEHEIYDSKSYKKAII